MNVQFKQWKCHLVIGEYSNNRIALTLIDAMDGQPIAVASVNMVEDKITKGCVYIKDYSENEGMVHALIDANIIEPEPVDSAFGVFCFVDSYRLKEGVVS
jgi:hypothetical protein